MNNKSNSNKTSAEAVLPKAKERFQLAAEAEKEMRRLALEDLDFRVGEQWPDDIKRSRQIDNRPCITINKLPQFVRQVTNDQRQNRPSIKVNPVDDKADIETAKVFQGLIRHIESTSNADVAYDTAFEGAATKGLGYFRIITDYCDPMSFEQDIKFKRVRNSFSVYMDPTYQEPDGSDADWAMIVSDLTPDDYKSQYPDSKMASMNDWQSIGDKSPSWMPGGSVRVAEYFYKEHKETTIVLLNNKQVVEKSKLPKVLPEGLEVVGERKTTLPSIKWLKINAVEILEETDWLGQWIPIIPVLGDELDVDGERILEGIIRHAKDPQRMYNYWASNETEAIALAPKAPYIGAAGQFEGFEAQWAQANVKNIAFLQYNPKGLNGVMAPPPQRNSFEPAVMAITQARMQSSDDLKATTGIYDATLGNRSNENSGVAIQRRNHQAQTNNFHYVDNLTRSIRHAGRMLVDLIPKVYDTERAITILGEDGEPEMVEINKIFEKDGEQKHYNLSVGKYDVSVSTGPSYATKRQESVESMLALSQANPQVMQVAGDLMVRNMDWPGAQEIADRLKKILPPGIAEEKDGEKKQLPPEVQQQMQQMNQMIEQLTQSLHQAHDAIDKDLISIESRERIEMLKIQTNAEIEMAKLGSQESALMLKQDVEMIKHRLNHDLKMNEPIEIEQNEAAGPDQAAQPNDLQQQPTGGQSPGSPMGV